MKEKELIEKRNENIERMNAILNTAKAENRIVTEAESTEFEALSNETSRIDNMLKMQKDLENRNVLEVTDERELTKAEKDYKSFDNYIRTSVTNIGEMTKGNNGYVIPQTIADMIVKKMYNVSPIIAKARKFHTKGKLLIPTLDGKYTVAWATEFSALSSQTKDFGKVELNGFLAGALVLISESLINNAEVDIVDIVTTNMAESIAMFIEQKGINGESSYCNGIVRGLGSGQKVTASSATAVTSDEVVKLLSKVHSQYRKDALFIVAPATLEALRLLKGSDGHYLLNDDISSPFGHTLLGYPVYESDNMPAMTTGNMSIIFGNMDCLGLKISEDIDVKVLNELYATQHAVGVCGYVEFDADVIAQQGIAGLVQA